MEVILKNIVEHEYGTFSMEDGIFFFEYKEKVTLDLTTAQQIVKDVSAYLKGEKYPCFCDITGIVDTEKQARDYIAVESARLFTRIGYLSLSHVSTTIASFFMAVNKPQLPLKIFDNRESVIAYLKEE